MIQKRLNFDQDIACFTEKQQSATNAIDTHKFKFVLYGGALGGGKSYWLRWMCIRYLMWVFKKYSFANVTVMLACEDYPSLKDRQLQKIAREFPDWMGTLYSDHKEYGRSYILEPEYGGGIICFRNLDDASKYASAEFSLIAVDELTKNSYDTFTFLRTRLRWPGIPDIDCLFLGGTNPGGIGHGWVKQFWMDSLFPNEFIYPTDYRSQFLYVPSRADDNPHLDASYWAMLSTLPEHLRKSFRDGDWNAFVGQAFQEWAPPWHVIDPVPVPAGAPVYFTYDWGFAAPFSIGWWWIDAEGRALRFAEWYGWNGTPNQGLRFSDSRVADGVNEKEMNMRLENKKIIRFASHDCFQKKPNYRGGGQMPSTAEVFRGKNILLHPTDPDRMMRIKQFRERLKIQVPNWIEIAQSFNLINVSDGMELRWIDAKANPISMVELKLLAEQAGVDTAPRPPMLQSYSTCKHFIRTIPDLSVDKHNVEDVDTKQEDHAYDEACQICVARPLKFMGARPEKKIMESKDLDSTSQAAWREHQHIQDEIKLMEEYDASTL